MERFLALIFLTPLISFAMDYSEAEKLIQPYDQATNNYLNERLAHENNIALDEKGGCYSLPGGGITQIIRINQSGIIDLVVSNVKNQKSECFKNTYFGSTFKAPPTAPIYIKQQMGYHSAPRRP